MNATQSSTQMNICRIARWQCLALLVTTCVFAVTTHAATVAEWDFRVDEDLITAGNGASTGGVLLNGATVNTGAAVGTARSGKLTDGYLDVTDTTTGTDQSGLITLDNWEDYFGTTSFTDGTIVAVFQPKFTAEGRHTLVSHRVQGGSNGQVWMYLEADNAIARVGADTNTATVIDVPIDNDKWYFMAISWETGGEVRVYYREAVVDSTLFTATDPGPVSNTDNSFATPITVGARDVNFSPDLSDNADSYLAYVLLTDESSSFDDLNELFNTLIPEPGSMTILAAGLGFVFRRRRES